MHEFVTEEFDKFDELAVLFSNFHANHNKRQATIKHIRFTSPQNVAPEFAKQELIQNTIKQVHSALSQNMLYYLPLICNLITFNSRTD